MTKRQPTNEEFKKLIFAWKVAKHVKSNAIILARGSQTVDVGTGQMNRINLLKIVIEKMKIVKHGLDEKLYPLVMASDAFFSFSDVVDETTKIWCYSNNSTWWFN
jgi:phosphoribosylaminoimidazolecarboxamide formyltransferase/IMP cyclohydrolase